MSTLHFRISMLLVLVLNCLAFFARAQADTINISNQELATTNLKAGLHQYLVYFENPKKQKLAGASVWNRQVNFKNRNGKEVIEVIQHWFNSDTAFNRYVYSISQRHTFEPIYHYTKGSRGVEAFDFERSKITGSDSITGNNKNDLEVTLVVPTLNWELDLEIFSTLPIKKEGQRFIINFYHPGGKTPPAYYEYKITGAEKIATVEGKTIDCWTMKINYTENDWAIFWISKKSKEVIKMQEFFRGGYRYKVRFLTPIPLSRS